MQPVYGNCVNTAVDGRGGVGGVVIRKPDLRLDVKNLFCDFCVVVFTTNRETNDLIGISELESCGKLSRLLETAINGWPFASIRPCIERLTSRELLKWRTGKEMLSKKKQRAAGDKVGKKHSDPESESERESESEVRQL